MRKKNKRKRQNPVITSSCCKSLSTLFRHFTPYKVNLEEFMNVERLINCQSNQSYNLVHLVSLFCLQSSSQIHALKYFYVLHKSSCFQKFSVTQAFTHDKLLFYDNFKGLYGRIKDC